ncbi:MAG: hypothetical protein Q8L47_03410 [bacterium]|nr:hypothetical protein [bacterium]
MLNLFTRSKNNPILKPNPENPWESLKVYNPGAIYEDETYNLFYRAMGNDWVSSIGHATSQDGENFTRVSSTPILAAEFDYEKKGLEDPRVIKVADNYFMAHTAYDGDCARLALATSRDLKVWEKHGPIQKEWDWIKHISWLKYFKELVKARFHLQRNWSKAGAIFPEIINGKYFLFFGDHHIWLSTSSDSLNWEIPQTPFLKARPAPFFDNAFIEMGPPPIITTKGWLVLYHGVDYKFVYRLGFLLLDLNDPTKILYRSTEPIFEPQEPYELKGIVDILPGGYKQMENMSPEELKTFINKMDKLGKMPRVAFVNGAVLIGDTLRIYYGASDSVICTATANINDILNLVK